MISKKPLSNSDYEIQNDEKHLHAQALKIKAIDKLPYSVAKKITHLDISNNYLSTLGEIEQFSNLEEINLRNNKIAKGTELLSIMGLRKLEKMYISGNPFLKEPLEEDVLELIIEKNTDIEILSGDTLKNVDEMKEGELKVVFLENYLKKINYHDELKRKISDSSISNRSVRNVEQNNTIENAEIFKKLMPQLYTAVEDPRIVNRIKKDALNMKKQNSYSFQEAIVERKKKQQKQVDNLIKDILVLVEEKEESRSNSSQQYIPDLPERENEDNFQLPRKNTMIQERELSQISYSPKRRFTVQNFSNYKERCQYGFDKFRYKKSERKKEIEAPSQNFSEVASSKQKERKIVTSEIQSKKSSEKSSPKRFHNKYQFNNQSPFKKYQSTVKDEIIEINQSLIHDETKKTKSNNNNDNDNEQENIGQYESNNFYSFNNTIPLGKRSLTNRSDVHDKKYIRDKNATGTEFKLYLGNDSERMEINEMREEIMQGERESVQRDKMMIRERESEGVRQIILNNQRREKTQEPKKKIGIDSERFLGKKLTTPQAETDRNNLSNYLSTGNNSYEVYEQIYYQNLTRYSPSFALLFSQIQSLEEEEKSVLIQALFKDHKEKTIQFFKEQDQFKNMREYLSKMTAAHNTDKEQMNESIQQLVEELELRKQYLQQSEREIKRLNELIKIVSKDCQKMKETNWELKEKVMEKDEDIKTTRAHLTERKEQIQYLRKCEDIEEKIKANYEKRIKNQNIQSLKKKMNQIYQIMRWKQKRNKMNQSRLLEDSWNWFKKITLQRIVANMKFKEKQKQNVKICFSIWKEDREKTKTVKQNEKVINEYLKNKNFRGFMKLLKNHSSKKKENRLKNFWAKYQFAKVKFYQFLKKTQASHQREQQKLVESNKHNDNRLEKILFNKLLKNSKVNHQKQIQLTNSIRILQKMNTLAKLRSYFFNQALSQEIRIKNEALARVICLKKSDNHRLEFFKLFLFDKMRSQRKTNKIQRKKKRDGLSKLMNVVHRKQVRSKTYQLKNFLVLKGLAQLLNKVSHRKIKCHKFMKSLSKKVKNNNLLNNLYRNKKQFDVERMVDEGRIRQFLYKLTKNAYNKKIYQHLLEKERDMEQAKSIIEKLKFVEQAEREELKQQLLIQNKLIEQKWIQKQAEYRNEMLFLQDYKSQREIEIKLLKNQIMEIKERENLHEREIMLMKQESQMINQERDQLKRINNKMEQNLLSTGNKYDRMLEMYSRAMSELDRKEKQFSDFSVRERERERERDKDRQRTLEKKNSGNSLQGYPKSPIHSSNIQYNVSEFTSLRNKGF